MIAEIGHFALALALAIALLQATLPLWGLRARDPALMGLASTLANIVFVAMLVAFSALLAVHSLSDFSVSNVFRNSHSAMPAVFRLSAAWGNHEGSMVLWVFILALFGAFVASLPLRLAADLKAVTLSVQGMISLAFLAFVLLTSNPFLRLDPAPGEGRELNPLLQDIGLALHPPLLYVGYVGFSLAYSFALAALITRRIDASWARAVRPWVLVAWIFLTLGIALGSYWAYYELGWGGWWFWDPVENASLMPWLSGTALLHSIIVMEKRNALRVWTLLLAIVTFSLSLIGTFLVRSGILTSVHAFAVDPARGIVILFILSLFIGAALALYAWRASDLKQGGVFAPLSREAALLLNNLFLATATATVFIGTLYPLALEALSDDKISVGPPYFNLTCGALLVPLLLCLPFGPMLAWKRGDLLAAGERLFAAAGLALSAAALAAWMTQGGPLLAVAGIALAVFVIAGAVSDLIFRARLFSAPRANALARLAGLPRQAFGTALGHAGLGVFLLGVVSAGVYEAEAIRTITPGDTLTLGRYQLRMTEARPRLGPNYQEHVAIFEVSQQGRAIGTVESAKRLYLASRTPTTETGQLRLGFGQIYVAVGEVASDGRLGVRAYWKPNVLLIWLGPVLMALGGLVSLSDRRLRIGAPARAARPSPAVPAQ